MVPITKRMAAALTVHVTRLSAGIAPVRRARPAGRCLRYGPCAQYGRPGDGLCTGAGQTPPGSRPTSAALRRGGSAAAARAAPGEGPVAAGTSVVGRVGVWTPVVWPGGPLSRPGSATRGAMRPTDPNRLWP